MKTALITGAGGGIGKVTTLKFIDEGYFVIGQYNKNRAGIDEIISRLEKSGKADYFFPIKADFSVQSEIDDMIKSVNASFKSITALVNNAGVGLYKLITETTDLEWDNIFSVNTKSVFKITNGVLNGMIKKGYGKIVNVSSIWGVVGGSMEVAYSASKSALIGYTKALAKEVAPSGITVNCVCPGVIDTPINAHLGKDALSDLAKETPLSRLGSPEEVAELIYYLCSEKSDFITGQTITIDGGFTL